MNEIGYRNAERALWRSVGLRPREQQADLPDTRGVRIQEAGDGPPLLFLHGAPNAGAAFAGLVAELPDFRCVVVDRPGAGLSPALPVPLDRTTLPRFADRFAVDVLDALGMDKACVVGSSFGGYLTLRAAAAYPERFDRLVLLGCPALAPGMVVPPTTRLLMSPARHLLRFLPASEKTTRTTLRQLGHGDSVDAGRISPEHLAWSTALTATTDTLSNDTAMFSRVGNPLSGFAPELTLSRTVLGAVQAPTMVISTAEDPFGGLDVTGRLAAALPAGELVPLPSGGHLPWLDDLPGIAARIRGHLRPSAREGLGPAEL